MLKQIGIQINVLKIAFEDFLRKFNDAFQRYILILWPQSS